MMETIGWNKIRVLVTNKCNYRCPFCHNEGQDKSSSIGMMTLDTFTKLVDILQDVDLTELNISGGEPFLNPQIVEMILYADNQLSCDISCATNLSLVGKNCIARLSHTRVKFNIQFPYVNKRKFHQSTGNGDFDLISEHISMVKEAGIAIGLNCVIQDVDETSMSEILNYAMINKLPLKLLPQIGNPESPRYKGFVLPMINQYATEYKDKGTGALRWIVEYNGHKSSVLYIDSPCFAKDFDKCMKFGEIRIHPDLMLQPCILQAPTKRLEINKGKAFAQSQLYQIWKDFKTC